jgi:hypothetical protein
MKKVHLVSSVTDVDIGYMKSMPPIPFIEAKGIVPTSGWRNAHLSPVQYVTPPADGIQDFEFVAEPPEGLVLQVETSVYTPLIVLEDKPDWMVGVRIKAQNSEITRHFIEPAKALIEADFEGDADGALALQDDETFYFDHVEDEIEAIPESGEQCHRFRLAKIGNIPQVKTEWENKCVRILGRRICTKVPVLYRRTCTMVVEAEVCWPGDKDIIGAIEDCAKQALAAGVLAGLLTGNLAAATATFTQYLKSCLTSKGIAAASRIRAGLRHHNQCPPWTRV